MDAIVRDLVALGMKEYEAKVYAALVGIGEGNAREIHIASGVPRPRVYDILEGLAGRAFVEVRQGSPLRYRPEEPGVVTARLRGALEGAADRALAGLDELRLETRPTPAPIWYLDGEWSIRRHLESLVHGDYAALTVVCMLGSGPGEYAALLSEAVGRHTVDVVVPEGAAQACPEGVRVTVAGEFCPFFQEKIYGKVFSRPIDHEGSVFSLEYIFMADDEESLIVYTENGRRKGVIITLPFITCVQHQLARKMIAGGRDAAAAPGQKIYTGEERVHT
ncbi:MAG TPA: TrmB family transcriptional regulator [Methanofollis liminatans]|uniref:TrmB family transcriptional regulator n=1 Tax=Methanofollis liminatans TaxID=2201 RepID=A0A831PMH2_9EURY|nr:TrmB family transcriptional regulator [Methanofollis liminatans]